MFATGPKPVVTCTRNGTQSVRNYDRPELFPNGQRISELPAAVYLETDPLPYYADRITVQTTCDDQGWGNTGHSSVIMIVSPPAGTSEATVPGRTIAKSLFHINDHGFRHRQQVFKLSQSNIDDNLSNLACPGSVIRIVLVSAPYPGFECRCRSACVTVHLRLGRHRYPTVIIRELLICQRAVNDNEETEEERLLSFVFQDAPKDIFSSIVQYAFA